MPSLKGIRTRIASVKSTQKITRAMKMVAAARLRRAQDAIQAQRPYAQQLGQVVADIVARLRQAGDESMHPLLVPRDKPQSIATVVLTSDRGLAGGFNSNLCRTVERWIVDTETTRRVPSIGVHVFGRKGRDYFRRRKVKLLTERPAPTPADVLEQARAIAREVATAFLDGEIDEVQLAYNEFKSALTQVPTVQQLIPLVGLGGEGHTAALLDYEYEPSKESLLATLLPLYLEVTIYRAMLESLASELGARMSAMDSATKNAKELIGRLTLEYNRARQAAITKELMEIVGGAEALKG